MDRKQRLNSRIAIQKIASVAISTVGGLALVTLLFMQAGELALQQKARNEKRASEIQERDRARNEDGRAFLAQMMAQPARWTQVETRANAGVDLATNSHEPSSVAFPVRWNHKSNCELIVHAYASLAQEAVHMRPHKITCEGMSYNVAGFVRQVDGQVVSGTVVRTHSESGYDVFAVRIPVGAPLSAWIEVQSEQEKSAFGRHGDAAI